MKNTDKIFLAGAIHLFLSVILITYSIGMLHLLPKVASHMHDIMYVFLLISFPSFASSIGFFRLEKWALTSSATTVGLLIWTAFKHYFVFYEPFLSFLKLLISFVLILVDLWVMTTAGDSFNKKEHDD